MKTRSDSRPLIGAGPEDDNKKLGSRDPGTTVSVSVGMIFHG